MITKVGRVRDSSLRHFNFFKTYEENWFSEITMAGSFTADEEIFRNYRTGFVTGVGGETTEPIASPYQFHISVIGI